MREIEFRYWSESDKEYKNTDDMPLISHDISRIKSLTAYDNDVFEQYTGLKDKNGKKIFDNDIIIINELKYVVDKGIDCKIYDFRDSNTDYDDKDYDLNYHNGDYLSDFNLNHIEIIGNIHENPELIK